MTLSLATIERILPSPPRSTGDLEAAYPPRGLPEGAQVTRVAPSPTGFLHIGTLYAALVCQRVARQTGGIFYLRLEDTDRKREVLGAADLVMRALPKFGLDYDEGPLPGGHHKGEYGPYVQSHRQEIYHAYTRRLLEKGLAYPCFVTPAEQEETAKRQIAAKVRPGYYGQWAVWRDRPEADVLAALDAGKSFVVRFRSQGDVGRKRLLEDFVKGPKSLPENDNDIVIMKADGLPTYHLAHVVDDHLMRTTLIVRGDEWLPSATLHLQLAEALGIEPFKYAHIPPIQKMDGSSRRKLSKRKDPEANAEFYAGQGYPTAALLEYLMNQANSGFEIWRRENPQKPYQEFDFQLGKMPKNSGGLFNLTKLDDVSRDYLASLPAKDLLQMALDWSKEHNHSLFKSLSADKEYSKQVLNIERGGKDRRKDICKFADLQESYGYFFDDIFQEMAALGFEGDAELSKVSPKDRAAIAHGFLETYDPKDMQEEWFAKLKKLGEDLGFTSDTKLYRQNPQDFKGSVAEVAMVLRVALAGRNRSPNLHEMMRVMGQKRVAQRLKSRLT